MALRPSFWASHATDLLVSAGEATLPNPFTAEAHGGKGWPRVTQPGSQDEPSWARAPSRQFDRSLTLTDPTWISSFPQGATSRGANLLKL